jgi:hypothetical protein
MHEHAQAALAGARARALSGARRDRDVELDRVDAGVGEVVDDVLDVPGLDAARHVRESGVRLAFLQEWAGVEQARPGRRTRVDRATQCREIRELAAEIEDGGDAGGEEQRRVPAIRPEHVDVHVGEAGNHEAATAVDDLRAFGRWRLRRRTDPREALAVDHDRGVGERCPPGAVDQGDAGDRERARGLVHGPTIIAP